MKITLQNIGTIAQATFDLDKDLIVFTGPNNTGKTYAAYCLYGLGRYIKPLPFELVDIILPNIEPLFMTGSVELNLINIFSFSVINKILQQYSLEIKKQLPSIFAVKKEAFADSLIELSLNKNFDLLEFFSSTTFYFEPYIIDNYLYKFNKIQDKGLLIISRNIRDINANIAELSTEKISYLLIERLVENILTQLISLNYAVFLTAERIGISLFWKDIYSNRFNKTNELLNLIDDNNSLYYIKKNLPIYSKIIQDAFRNYDQDIKTSVLDPIYGISSMTDELEQKILKGRIITDKEGEVYFQPNDSYQIKLQAASATVKSLASLQLYLKYSAYAGQTLIIDEPEINLHPDNQRLIARLIAKLSKLGVKVIISTHSDYIIRELNNLIMLHKAHPDAFALREKYGYDESEILDPDKIGAYLFKDHTAIPILVNETGMEATTVDEVISKQNNTATDIYWTLFEN